MRSHYGYLFSFEIKTRLLIGCMVVLVRELVTPDGAYGFAGMDAGKGREQGCGELIRPTLLNEIAFVFAIYIGK
jgi:hypothetical protein